MSTQVLQVKPFNCQVCKKAFTGRDKNSVFMQHFPCIISCGHSICISCLKKNTHCLLKKIICPLCQHSTNVTNEEKLMDEITPDYHALGVLANSSRRFSLNWNAKAISTDSRSRRAPVATEIHRACFGCQKDSQWYCEKCGTLLCSTCFVEVHEKDQTLDSHKAQPLFVDEYRSLIQKDCLEHKRFVEYYCEDDSKLICGLCLLESGEHYEHDVCRISEKNNKCSDEIRKARDMALKVCRYLNLSKQKISEVPSKGTPHLANNMANLKKEISDAFHELHSLLQLRELELIGSVDEKSHDGTKRMTSLLNHINEDILQIKVLISDADQFLNSSSTTAINGMSLLKRLMQVKETRCFLVPIDNAQDEIKFDLKGDMKQFIKSIGHIKARVTPKYSLVTENEVPPVFKQDYCPEEEVISISTETDSVSSEDLLVPAKPKKIIRAKPPPRNSCDSEPVILTHIKNPSSFYVQRLRNAENLAVQQQSITAFCRRKDNKKHIPNMLEVGELCLARYNGTWYRAQVKEVFEVPVKRKQKRKKTKKIDKSALEKELQDWSFLSREEDELSSAENSSVISTLSSTDITDVDDDPVKTLTKIRVFYIDFGNHEIIDISDIRTIQPQFKRLPALASECSLWKIIPVNERWSKTAIKHFSHYTANRKLIMKIMDDIGGVFQVDLLQPPANITQIENDMPLSIRESLIFLEEAIFPNSSLSNKSHLIKPNKCQSFYSPDPLTHSFKMRVKTIHVENPSKFFVKVVNSSLNYYDEMMKELQDYYKQNESDPELSVYYPQKGLPYVAETQTEDGVFWYRVLAKDFPGNGQVTVNCVDFGFNKTVHCSLLRKITDHFLKLPMQAHCCHLADVGPLRLAWNEEATEWFREATAQDLHIVVYSHNVVKGNIVSLFGIYPVGLEISLNVRIVHGGLARSLGPASIALIEDLPKIEKSLMAIKQSNISPISNDHSETDNSIQNGSQSQDDTIATVKIEEGIDSRNWKVEEICAANKETCLTRVKPKDVSPRASKAKLAVPLEVRVTYFESPSLFFIQMLTHDEDLKSLKKSLRKHYDKSRAVECDWKESKSCAAYDAVSKTWFRGVITGIPKDDHFEVYFYDYGNRAILMSDQLRKLIADFDEPKPLAYKCSLEGIRPAGGSNDWTKMACECMVDWISDENLILKIIDTNNDQAMLCVDLLKKEVVLGGALEADTTKITKISEKLIDLGLALPLKRIVSSPVSPVVEETPKHSATVFKPPIYQKWLQQTHPTWLNTSAIPTFIGYDGCIYLHPKEMENTLYDIRDGLHEAFESGRYHPPKEVVKEGQICVAKYRVDHKWYRAVINAVSLKNNVSSAQLTFVDYGNMEVETMESIRVHVAYTEVPLQCYECELHNCRPISETGQWPTSTLDYIHTLIVDKPCVINIEDLESVYPEKRLQISVTLYGGVSLLDHLIEKHLVRRIRSAPQEYMTIILPSQSPDYISIPLPPEGIYFNVVVTHVTETGHLFMQRAPDETPITPDEIMLNKVHSMYLDMMEVLRHKASYLKICYHPKIGETYCVQYSHDDEWYRALITSVSNGWASVTYIDYGNPEDVPLASDRIKELPKEYLTYPKQSFIATLSNIEPIGGIWDIEVNKEIMTLFKSYETDGYLLKCLIKDMRSGVPQVEIYAVEYDCDEPDEDCLACQPLINEGFLKTIK